VCSTSLSRTAWAGKAVWSASRRPSGRLHAHGRMCLGGDRGHGQRRQACLRGLLHPQTDGHLSSTFGCSELGTGALLAHRAYTDLRHPGGFVAKGSITWSPADSDQVRRLSQPVVNRPCERHGMVLWAGAVLCASIPVMLATPLCAAAPRQRPTKCARGRATDLKRSWHRAAPPNRVAG